MPRISSRFLASIVVMPIVCVGVPMTSFAANWRVESTVQLRETWTDNVTLQPGSLAKSDFVSEFMPGLRIREDGSRTRLDVDYRPVALFYADDSGRNDFLNQLNGFGVGELVEGHLFVEAHALISQQVVSAFGPQPTSIATTTNNRTETRQFSLSPYLKGRIGDVAIYEVRARESLTSTKSGTDADGKGQLLKARISDDPGSSRLGWIGEFKRQRNDYDSARDTVASLVRGTLVAYLSPEFWVFGRGGGESNDFTGERHNHGTYGFGFEWAPTSRSRVSGEVDERYFGHGFRLLARHRFERFAFEVVATRDDTNVAEQLERNPLGTLFERFSELYSASIANPEERDDRVRRLLANTGMPRESIPHAGYLTGGQLLERRIEATLAANGIRNTASFSAFRRHTIQLTRPIGLDPDVPFDGPEVRETGVSGNFSHQFTTRTSLLVSGAWTRNTGTGAESPKTIVRRVELVGNTRLGPRTSGSVGLRYARSSADGVNLLSGYRERAVFGLLSHSF